jgi:hypothetical protein
VKRLLLFPALALTISLAGCTKLDQGKARVDSAIDRTEQLAREFTYSEKAGSHSTVVTGSVQDDLRYSVAATVDGTAAASEVVVDDARAMRVADASLLQNLTVTGAGARLPAVAITGVPVAAGGSPSPAAGATPAASPTAGSIAEQVNGPAATVPAGVPGALQSGLWVVDKAGAAALTAGANQVQVVGKNPLLDALTSLEYVRTAVDQASDVAKFNPESETYRPKLDPFPRPAAGTTRYDVVPPILKPRSKNGSGQLQLSLPDTTFFRLMAVYVKDGVVVEVREKIDIVLRLEDVQSNLQARLGDFVKVGQGASVQTQASALETTLNRQLPLAGKPPIRLRELEVRFANLGHPAPVAVPDGAVPGDLSGVGAHGQLLYEHR